MSKAEQRRGRGRSPHSVATRVYERVRRGGERYWTLSDFSDLPATAAAHALSRLVVAGELRRVRKGIYYRPKKTVLGTSLASPSVAVSLAATAPLHPSGLTASAALGLSTQNPMRPEFATASAAAPSAVADAVVHTGRPRSRLDLDASDAALFELLRDRARYSDLSPEETVDRLVRMLADRKRFERLARAALDEPPRVRAMLGALGERACAPAKALQSLRASLNPLTKFDFGVLRALPNAKDWQAR
jgi:hypothetical protein